MEDAVAMERAIELARAAAERGDEPYGSVIVVEGRIVSEGENSVATDLDPTAHAEITAIRRACRDLERTDLSGGTIYASGEPCWTCSAAIRGAACRGSSMLRPCGYWRRHVGLSDLVG
ncbi:MAG: nucleoside deaminase [Chloroflexia bacterium]